MSSSITGTVATGFTCLQGDVAANVENVTHKFPMPPVATAFHSPKDLGTWATPFTQTR